MISKTTIHIKNHRLKMLIGIDEHEYHTPQEVIINAWLDVHINDTNLKADNINDVYNYVDLKREIETIANRGHIGLIENFAEQIADSALKDTMVSKAVIQIEKPEVFNNCDSVGVTITKETSSC
ncbi:MAG: dihydroneopterin aldolase [Bdellovibrionales bacterium]